MEQAESYVEGDARPMPGEPPADVFLQWKGTDACFDFTCSACGASGHVDADFAYRVQCRCGAVYEMPNKLQPRRVEPDSGPVVEPNFDV